MRILQKAYFTARVECGGFRPPPPKKKKSPKNGVEVAECTQRLVALEERDGGREVGKRPVPVGTDVSACAVQIVRAVRRCGSASTVVRVREVGGLEVAALVLDVALACRPNLGTKIRTCANQPEAPSDIDHATCMYGWMGALWGGYCGDGVGGSERRKAGQS